MNEEEIKRGEREKIILALVEMRVEKFASQKTMLDFLMNKLGYKQSYAYELMAESRKRITEIFKEEHEEAFSKAVARMEEIIETTRNEKIRMEAEKELNKLLGLYKPQRVDITTNGKDITGIQIEIVTNESKDKGNTGTE